MNKIYGIVAALFCIAVTGCSSGVIEEGHVGVKSTVGSVDPNPIGVGWYLKWFSNVTEYTKKEVAIALNDMTPQAADKLSLKKLDALIYYSTQDKFIPALQVKYENQSAKDERTGVSFPAYNMVRAIAIKEIGDAVSKMDSLTIHQHRNGLENQAKTAIQAALNKSDPGVFTITRVVVGQVLTDDAIQTQIRDKVRMEKQVETKQAELQLAKAEAERVVVEAKGLADRNELISRSVSNQLIEYNKAIALQNCANNKNCTMIVGNATPIVGLGK